MLNAYALRHGRLHRKEITEGTAIPADALWLDLLQPSPDEREWVAQAFGEALPTEQGIAEIEASSRCFQEGDTTHVRSYFLYRKDDRVHMSTMAFVVSGGTLVTLRPEEPLGLGTFVSEAASTAGLADDPFSVMLRFYEAQIDGLADMLEGLHRRLEQVGRAVVERHRSDLEDLIDAVTGERDVNDQVRLSLMDKERVLSYLLRRDLCPQQHLELLSEILRDIESLNAHSQFLFERVDALMAEIMGRISLEQNRIIKLFSVAAVALLPPTLIASLYGMNFVHMPELGWPLGYPIALVAMVASGLAPYLIFRRKGWL